SETSGAVLVHGGEPRGTPRAAADSSAMLDAGVVRRAGWAAGGSAGHRRVVAPCCSQDRRGPPSEHHPRDRGDSSRADRGDGRFAPSLSDPATVLGILRPWDRDALIIGLGPGERGMAAPRSAANAWSKTQPHSIDEERLRGSGAGDDSTHEAQSSADAVRRATKERNE